MEIDVGRIKIDVLGLLDSFFFSLKANHKMEKKIFSMSIV